VGCKSGVAGGEEMIALILFVVVMFWLAVKTGGFDFDD